MGYPQSNDRQNDCDVHETSPLLSSYQDGRAQNDEEATHDTANGNKIPEGQDGDSRPDEIEPLPKLQIFLLCYCALVEPVSAFCIFPFINQMIKDTGGILEEDVGFWSGMIESLFSVTQMFLMGQFVQIIDIIPLFILYGRASDRLGRYPVLIFSLAGISVATALFGISKTILQMIIFRCLAGVFAGCSVTIRAMLTENSTTVTQAKVFSLYAFTRNLGIFLGPLIGGALSSPATQYPSIFGHNKFLSEYPYALPTITVGVVALTALIPSAFFLEETLNRKVNGGTVNDEPMSTWQIMTAPGVATVLYIYAHAMLLGMAFTAVMPVFLFTSVPLAGFGFSPPQISIFIAVCGASQALWILVAFPLLQARFSTGAVLRVCAICWPFMFILFPIGNEFLRHNLKIPFWVALPLMSMIGSGVSMAFTCVQLNLNDIAPSPSTLGTLNALALTLVSAIRAVAPALFSSLFATGVKIHFMDGHLVWAVLTLIAIIFAFGARYLPKKAEGRIKRDGDLA